VAPLLEDQLDLDMKHCFENLIVIDVGANLTNKKYSRDLDSVVQRARDAGSCCRYYMRIINGTRAVSSFWGEAAKTPQTARRSGDK